MIDDPALVVGQVEDSIQDSVVASAGERRPIAERVVCPVITL